MSTAFYISAINRFGDLEENIPMSMSECITDEHIMMNSLLIRSSELVTTKSTTFMSSFSDVQDLIHANKLSFT